MCSPTGQALLCISGCSLADAFLLVWFMLQAGCAVAGACAGMNSQAAGAGCHAGIGEAITGKMRHWTGHLGSQPAHAQPLAHAAIAPPGEQHVAGREVAMHLRCRSDVSRSQCPTTQAPLWQGCADERLTWQ